MQYGTGSPARTPRNGNRFTAPNGFSLLDKNPVEVRIECANPVGMLDFQGLAKSSMGADFYDFARSGRNNGVALFCEKIHSAMRQFLIRKMIEYDAKAIGNVCLFFERS